MSFKAVFIDRDGVINHDYGYVHKWENFRFTNNLKKGLLLFQKQEYKLFIITNQSGIGRGIFSLDAYNKLTKKYLSELKKSNIFIEEVYHCPHDPRSFKNNMGCNCRKPNPGMIFKAIKDFDIDPKSSILIGDKLSDIQSGINAGIPIRYLVSPDDYSDEIITKKFKTLYQCAKYHTEKIIEEK